jgi:hypothetical protein
MADEPPETEAVMARAAAGDAATSGELRALQRLSEILSEMPDGLTELRR